MCGLSRSFAEHKVVKSTQKLSQASTDGDLGMFAIEEVLESLLGAFAASIGAVRRNVGARWRGHRKQRHSIPCRRQ